MKTIVAALSALLLAGCGSSDTPQDKFNSDVSDHGIMSSRVDLLGNNLGTDVCTDIKSGQVAANVAINVANGTSATFTLPEAEIITYYAITDICPDQISQRQDHWKDGS